MNEDNNAKPDNMSGIAPMHQDLYKALNEYKHFKNMNEPLKKLIIENLFASIKYHHDLSRKDIILYKNINTEDDIILVNYILKVCYILGKEYKENKDVYYRRLLTDINNIDKISKIIGDLSKPDEKISKIVEDIKAKINKDQQMKISISKDHRCPNCKARKAKVKPKMSACLDEMVNIIKECLECKFIW
jgi:DNA-directed RNA polymerase subunit M/transcription elongation factor TFIIS